MIWIAPLLLNLLFAVQQPTEVLEKFEPVETTIFQIHQAIRSGHLTCRQLVEAYLKRIYYYDQSTKLNSIVIINPGALAEADRLDEEFQQSQKLRSLHGIPVIVKDNFDTENLQTTGGSLALKGFCPAIDAYQVHKIREAGAIVLAKANMAEWALSPYVTESSIAGVTCNPFDLERVPAGSSGGTAAAIAANFGAVGLGTDTGSSIRGPSSHTALVGIRSTMGLTSRDGIIPVSLRHDIGGPMARTVEDAVRILEVIAGYDPADPITELSIGKVPENYTQFLQKDGLQGARLGLFRRYVDTPTADPEIKTVFAKAIEDLESLGAIIVDPFEVPDFKVLTKNLKCDSLGYDMQKYLASVGNRTQYKDVSQLVESGLLSPYMKHRLKNANLSTASISPCKDVYHDPRNIRLREAILVEMDNHQLDAIIYPTWSNIPRMIGDLESPVGDNNQILSPQTGFPAFTVPMGFINGSLPTGITFLGRLFSEPNIIKFVYAFEQATKYRRPPKVFPPLNN